MAISHTPKGQGTHSSTKAGGIVGRVMDALTGENRTHRVDYDRESEYWRDTYKKDPQYKGHNYDDYHHGYLTGYEGYSKYEPGTRFEDAESTLREDYEAKGSKVPWDQARHHARSAWDRIDRGEAFTVPLTEEELKVSKREVEGGGVRLRKVVKTETVSQPVELRREEAVVERVAPTTDKVPADAFQERTIEVPLKREEAVVEKSAHVTGEVHVKKGATTETHHVKEELRKEDVEVDKQGGAEIRRDDITKK